MRVQEGIAAEINATKKGKTLEVVIDREDGDYYIGRTEFDSPEVDPEVLIKKDNQLSIGKYYDVLIDEAETFDLYGRIV